MMKSYISAILSVYSCFHSAFGSAAEMFMKESTQEAKVTPSRQKSGVVRITSDQEKICARDTDSVSMDSNHQGLIYLMIKQDPEAKNTEKTEIAEWLINLRFRKFEEKYWPVLDISEMKALPNSLDFSKIKEVHKELIIVIPNTHMTQPSADEKFESC